MSYIKTYSYAIKKSIKLLFQYPTDTYIWIISIILKHLASLLTIYFMTNKFVQIGGWYFREICLILGVGIIIEGTSQIFFDAVWSIGDFLIQRGQLDIFLVRPKKLVFQLFCENINPQCFISVVVGTGISVWSSQRELANNSITIVVELLLLGVFINTSIYFIFNCLNFWLISSKNVAEFVQILKEFFYYPLDLFPNFIKFISLALVPYGFCGYYPCAYLLGKTELNIPKLIIVISCILLIFDGFIWRKGTKNYESVGG